MKNENSFSMHIDGVFYIHNSGVVVTGRVESGCIKVGDTLKISGDKTEIITRCIKLEAYCRKILQAHAGHYVGITLSDVSKSQIQRGMQLSINNQD